MTTATESSSDALARRIGGGMLAIFGLAMMYFAGYMVVTRGHGNPLDTEWISHIGGSSSQTRPGVFHGVALIGLVVVLAGLRMMIAKARKPG